MPITSTTERGFATWLPDVLRDAGVDVYVMPGAETRSTWKTGFRLDAIIWHHTATSLRWSDGHVAALLRDGRRDLRGPLSQVGIERDGTWVIVALGRANHNGYGSYGNDSLGLEFYNAGDGLDPWPGAQVEAGLIGSAAVRNYLHADVPVVGHAENDPRKIDPLGLDMDNIRWRLGLHQLAIAGGIVQNPLAGVFFAYKEVLGRAPESRAAIEWAEGFIKNQGLDAFIRFLLDSDEGKRLYK